jgi:predicted dehydrogenase
MMKSFRIVIAGCGIMANTWVEYALSRVDAEIVALVDVKRENAKALAARHGLNSKIYSDISEAIKDSDANLVFNTTSPAAHREIVIKSLRSGCNVLGEKPMANSIEEAEEMVKAAEESGCTYAVMQNRRYNKNIRALKELLTQGTIGKPTFTGADFFLGPHFGGFRDLMEHPLLLDMSIHTFDQARFITGADAVSVYCHEFNPSGSWYRGDAAAACTFEMSDGSVFSYRGSWCAEGAPTSWESFWRITGAKGTAIWDGSTLPYCEVPVASKEHRLLNDYKRIEGKASWQGRDGHFGCLDEMFSALLEGRKAETDCTDNIKSMKMVLASLESAEKQRKIEIVV